MVVALGKGPGRSPALTPVFTFRPWAVQTSVSLWLEGRTPPFTFVLTFMVFPFHRFGFSLEAATRNPLHLPKRGESKV